MKASDYCSKASELVGGIRDRQHGAKRENFNNIGAIWNAYLRKILKRPITAAEVGLMLVLFKVARTQTGDHNPDDYTDMCGYSGCSGEIADQIEDESESKCEEIDLLQIAKSRVTKDVELMNTARKNR